MFTNMLSKENIVKFKVIFNKQLWQLDPYVKKNILKMRGIHDSEASYMSREALRP